MLRGKKLALPHALALGCALAVVAGCGGESAAGLRPVGDHGFEVATDRQRLMVDRGAIYVAGHGEPKLVFDAMRVERGGRAVDGVTIGALDLDGSRASYGRGERGREWYEIRNGEALEQGWSFEEAPGGVSGGPLELVLDLGDAAEVLRETEDEVVVQLTDGEVSYSGLVARDASGAVLTTSMSVRGRSVVLAIDDADAVYPIEIDPLLALTGYLLDVSSRTVEYGYSVAIDGNNLFVGQPDVPRDTTNGLTEGAVHQYSRASGAWTYVRRIRVAGNSASGAFGSSVAVHGDWLVVGAPLDATYGRVHAIRLSSGFNGLGVPNTVQAIVSPNSVATFGTNVAISGSRMAVSGTLLGKVYVFNRSGTTWSTAAAHEIASVGAGATVALPRNNANLLVIGSPALATNGQVRIHRWNGSTWGSATVISPLSSPSQQTRFGVSVAVSGAANAEHVAIGCLSNSGTRAQLVRTIYNGSSWSTPSIQINGSMSGYLSTTDTFLYGTDNRTPHVAIAPDSSVTGGDVMLLGLPNAVASSAGTGTVVGTHIALPSGLSAAQRTLPGESGVTHRGRSVATDGVTIALGDLDGSGGWITTHQISWANGTACTAASQCASGICVDGVCCNAACGGGLTNDCQACSTARGAAGNGTCGPLTAAFAPTVTCRTSAGVCDVAETCVAGSTSCPGNAFRPTSYQCRASSGGCDAADFCTGSSAACADTFQPVGTVCRAAAPGTCDRAETCSGTSVSCPVDTPQPAGTSCGSDTGDPCDLPDQCDGVSFSCPERVAAAGTVCRAAVSACDTAETCTGASTTCPTNAPPRPAGTVCRAANPALACDAPESCDGVAYACPADAPASMGTLCRAAVGACDLPETCTGASFACPSDALAAMGTPCRPAAGVCDLPEVCTGTDTACPPDQRADAFTLCRAPSNSVGPGGSDCDVPEYCNGSVDCPSDVGGTLAECCVASEWDDGQTCREDYLCVDSVCEPRGCGDGWLEGSERCDDHNTSDGDGCSSDCTPAPFVVAAREGGSDEPAGDRSVAIDGEGRVLVVWSEHDTTSTRVLARRYSRYGTDPAGTPAITQLASLPGPGWDASPVVAPLASGWAIAWRQPAGTEIGGVAVSRLSAEGVLGRAIRVSAPEETLAQHPGIAALADGALLVTWTDATDPSRPLVRYRWVVGDAVSGAPLAIPSDAGGDAAVATSGSTAMIVWTEQPPFGERPRVLARRLTRTAVLDVAPLVIAEDASQPSVSGGTGQFVIAWVAREDDPNGDIFVRVAPVSGALDGSASHVTATSDPDRPYGETAPSILGQGTGWVVGWEVPTQRSARIAAGGGATLPAELASTLEPELRDTMPRDISLAAGARGTWVVWSSGSAPEVSAARATWAFVLPPS